MNNFSRLRARRGYDEGGTIADDPFAAPPEVRMAPNANVRMSGGLPLSDPMVNFSTPQRGLPWGPDAFAGPGGLPLGPGRDGSPSRGDQLQFRNWVPAFWPPGISEPDAPTEAPPDEGPPPPREEFTYPTETIPQADPPPIPDFLSHPNTQMLPSGQYMPNMRWVPPLRPMEDERQGYDAGGTIAGMPIGGGGGSGGQPSMSMDQLSQQYPMAQSMWGNPELLRPLTQMFENIQVPGEIGPAEQLRGMSQFPFQNLGRTMGLSPMSSGEIWQRMMETGHVPGRGAEEVYSYMMQDPGNSNRIWEYMDPTWPVDMPAPSQPTPGPQPEPEPTPAPAPVPRQEYTYPTETLPQAEPPPVPGFLQGHSAQQRPMGGAPRWIPPIRPISGQTFNQDQRFMPHSYGGRAEGGATGNADRDNVNGGVGGTIAGVPVPASPAAAPAPERRQLSQALLARLEPLYQAHPDWRDNPEYFDDLNPNAPEFYYTLINRTMGNSLAQKDSPWMGVLNSDQFIPQSPQPYHMVPFPPPGAQAPPLDPPAPETPAPESVPDEPRQEYTYPTETIPQAEPPPVPGFLQGHSAQQTPRWIPPIAPIGEQTMNQRFMPRAYGGPTHGYGQAVGPEQARPSPALAAHIARFQERFGQRFADGGAINRARLRAIVSAKRGDFNG